MAANTATNGTRRFRLVCPKPVPRCGAICPPGIQAWTADYRVSWHQKVANGQLLSLTLTFRTTVIVIKALRGAAWRCRGPLEYLDRRDALRAWPHKVSLGVEYQHTFKAINNVTESATTRFSPLECTGKCEVHFRIADTAFGQPFFLCDEGIIWQPQNRDSQVTDTQWQG